MKTGIVVLGMGLSMCVLWGCTSPATSTAVSSDVAAAELGLTTAEQAALVYTGLPRCPAAAPCSDPATVTLIKSLDNQAYAAVKAAEGNEALLSVATTAIAGLSAAIPTPTSTSK